MKYIDVKGFAGVVLISLFAPMLGAQSILSEAVDKWPDSRYVDHGNGTVSDKETRLMWSKCLVGLSEADCLTGLAVSSTWALAVEDASASNLAGCTDWRLPSLKEMNSLIALNRYDPAINITLFPNPEMDDFVWTSSPRVFTGNAWRINIKRGLDASSPVTNAWAYRLVRDDTGPCS